MFSRGLKVLPKQSLFPRRILVQRASLESQFSSNEKVARAKPSIVKILADLSKFRLSSLVVVTSGAGFAAAGLPLDMLTMSAACVGTALCAASAGTFNQISEIDRDAAMKRTFMRPLPSGHVSVNHALTWGVTTAAAGTSLLLFGTNPVVAALGLANIALYAGPYTFSKKHTELNTWVGAIVGAIPPVMGWAAATGGSVIAAEPVALASLLFLWQFPHFFSLSWMHREDYARGQFQMVATNDPDGQRSAGYILEYSLYLTAFPLITSMMGITSHMFTIEGTAANLYLLYLAKKFRDDRSNANARKIFLTSLWYLPLLLGGFVFHSRMWNKDVSEDEDKNMITDAVLKAKGILKGACIHEVIVHNDTTNSPQLCPKIVTDQAADVAVHSAEVLANKAKDQIAGVVDKDVM